MIITPQIALDELEHDALTELLNIGVSRAAASLRNMIGYQVLLSVPAVAVVTRERAGQILTERVDHKLVAVHQAFEGDLSGRALLIFPESNSLELVRAVAGSDLSLEDVIDLEQEALAETGNIILNGCLATIANMLHRSLKMSLPEILRGRGQDFFDLAGASAAEDIVLFLYIDFSVNERDIRGYIAMLMDLPALAALKSLLGEFIRRTTGEPFAADHDTP
ncbi:chemotaxis protein CheX [Acidisoma cladoniae]|jgi:chemotaxis protein CheC|uniref:chemotaxis protein CheX n=1 Tax=Acidisoma cladoniae TaxID=3040935 RepID=UPI00254C2D38|nr:chemotaxis protein CheX [Acidisoma sp. PAMC 29798]